MDKQTQNSPQNMPNFVIFKIDSSKVNISDFDTLLLEMESQEDKSS